MSKFCKEVNLILEDLQNGDNSKQKELFDFTYNHLKVISLMYAADKNDYEDILIESYLRVFKYLKTADLSKDGYNWLCKIVQNVAIDFNRKTENTFPLDKVNDKKIGYSVEEVIADKDMLLREIGKLSEDDKQILYMRFWQDYTVDQIAIETECSKSRIHKRILMLIDQINKKLHGDESI